MIAETIWDFPLWLITNGLIACAAVVGIVLSILAGALFVGLADRLQDRLTRFAILLHYFAIAK